LLQAYQAAHLDRDATRLAKQMRQFCAAYRKAGFPADAEIAAILDRHSSPQAPSGQGGLMGWLRGSGGKKGS